MICPSGRFGFIIGEMIRLTSAVMLCIFLVSLLGPVAFANPNLQAATVATEDDESGQAQLDVSPTTVCLRAEKPLHSQVVGIDMTPQPMENLHP